ncbi:hypothetical protein KPL70_024048 [Citrus sinensis]|nr:hypothetical protein KPL70_024048 [Citrus sinensis]
MGKRDKKQQRQQRRDSRRGGGFSNYQEEEEGGYEADYSHHSSLPSSSDHEEAEEETGPEEDFDKADDDRDKNDTNPSTDMPSKFLLYQQSVQSPKGDISYLQKFFLIYVGGRQPLHLQEDFCGTALLSTEWLRSDSRRTAVGLDLDLEALEWCMENNLNKVGADGYSRISLFHGNVLQPLEAKLVRYEPQKLVRNISLEECDNTLETSTIESAVQDSSTASSGDNCNLVLYFKHVLHALSKKGGIFVMDLYGGTSSEQKLRLQRRFANFTYVWEQAEFDIIERKTRISLHFHLQKEQKKLRHAFSYNWRLWSLPEIKDCLEEAGFRSVHFWLREMPDAREMRNTEGLGVSRDAKYEEIKCFQQQDAWNAYIVAVAK